MSIWSRIILYLTKSSKKISTYWKNRKKKEWEDTEAALRAAFICCDAMYCEVIANPQQAVPLEKSQFRAEELEDVLPEYKIAAGVYAPNDEIYGKFHVLLPVNEKTKDTF